MLICSNCVMDETDPDISFDKNGICNHCIDAFQKFPKYTFTPEQEKENLEKLSFEVKRKKRGEYDCIIGLSGGVDSSYLAHLAKIMDLNPLCVHFDNGWNSEISISNIKKIISKLNFNLKTVVIDWPEFRDIQRSFFHADVIDIEIVTDNAIITALMKIQKEYKIASIFSGSNFATEHGLPNAWNWNALDFKNIKDIHKKFGQMKLKNLLGISTLKYMIYRKSKIKCTFYEPLNFINYKKNLAMDVLKNEYDWHYYGGKHYESRFTKFFQAYYLPTKFNVDKRKAHLSSLIRNKEIPRNKALEELDNPLYTNSDLDQDYKYVIKKLGFSEEEFKTIMNRKPVGHNKYASDINLIKKIAEIYNSIF